MGSYTTHVGEVWRKSGGRWQVPDGAFSRDGVYWERQCAPPCQAAR